MSKPPKGIKGTSRKYREAKSMARAAVQGAMEQASKAIDELTAEIAAYRRVVIAERAQVIYYTDKYCAVVNRSCLDVQPIPFLDLPEDQQTEYTKKAIFELNGDTELAPHLTKGAKHLII